MNKEVRSKCYKPGRGIPDFGQVKSTVKAACLLLLALVFLPVQGFAQHAGVKIEGVVADRHTSEPLIGARIIVAGTGNGTETDVDGRFSLTVNVLPVGLQISYIGYHTEEVDVYEYTDPLSIRLRTATLLDEVVVIGYAQTKRSAVASAISKIDQDKITPVAASSLTEKLQGQAGGLLVSSSSGVPGSAMLVRLRGTTSVNAGNEPLYVVDGVFINNKTLQGIASGGQTTNALADLNPADIEKVEILKDANATAIYGSRGSNGVILVTTKRGAAQKTTVHFNAEAGFGHYDKLWALATGPEHAQVINEAWVNDGNPYETRPFRPKNELVNGEPGLGAPEEQGTYDRMHVLFRTALQQTYNVSVSGGDAKTRFYLSGEYTSQEAIIKLQDFQRYGFRVNLDHDLSTKVRIGSSLSYASTLRHLCRAGDTGGILNTGIHTPTLTPIFTEDGAYNRSERFNNPYVLLENNNHHTQGSHLIGNAYLTWEIIRNLSFKSSWSLDNSDYKENAYYNANLNEGKSTDGSATESYTTNQLWTAEQLLSWLASYDKHFISLFAGNTLQHNVFERSRLTGTNFPSIAFSSISSAAVTTGTNTGKISSGLLSWFGRANYSYADKYSVDVNLRADASSRFGKSNQWGYFPSFGASWRAGEEKFIKDIPVISELKLIASIGWTGNQDIADFAALGLWAGGNNYQDKAGTAPYQLANPDLKWETTRQTNVGIESSFFKSRLDVKFNYYNKYTYDLLLNVPVPAKTGFSSTFGNIGEMSNKGFEIEIGLENIQTKTFKWNTSLNFFRNVNRIEKLPSSFTQYNRDWVRLEEGYPMYSFWLYKQLYVDPQTGNAVYDDSRTGDGKITTDDRQIVGDIWPAFTGGLFNAFKYKNIELSLLFNFSYGNEVFNMNRYFQEHAGNRGTQWSLQASMMRRWQQPGDQTDIPRITNTQNADGSFNHNYESSRFLEDASYLRVRNISLAYIFPPKIIAKTGLNQLRVYVNATNLLTFTNYSGADPEVNVAGDYNGGVGTVQGLDFSTPPHPRTIVFGLNLTF
ncbi:MAG: TonB-dependent receptor [Tannerellaceae bacterium]|jgi:TonB-linked SusC/RagA family outer membrane protein|nr:TonB-dependent receptor [Tannerellaceae bacterium]